MKKIGVLGAGVMGIGVAQCAALAVDQVILIDTEEAQLHNARNQIRQNLRMQRLFNTAGPKGKPGILNRITFTTDYEELKGSDFIIENVVENWAIKEQVYRQIDAICPQHCIFAANTSAISITRLGGATTRPDRVLGMHFMNPAPLKPMVEVVRGHHTSESTLDTAKAVLSAMGKQCIVVNDMPGFVSNRVLMITINEAVFLIQDRVAKPDEIDLLFKSCFGHKMGPLETADLIGLDTILYSLEVLYESYNDDKYRPCPLLKKMVWAGLHGRKNGRGFYDYVPEPCALAVNSHSA
jgi:3-hydroxybutyryl-CoA dehydrogenase